MITPSDCKSQYPHFCWSNYLTFCSFLLQVTTLSVIILCSLFVNIIVFMVFYRKPLLLTISNRFVLNLAAASFILTIFFMPQVLAAAITDHWPLDNWILCQITGAATIGLFAACIATLLLIAVDRFFAIMKPLHYGMCVTARRATLLLVLVWLSAILVALPPLFGWNRVIYQRPLRMCSVDWEDQSIIGRTYTYTFVMICFCIPFIGLICVYVTATQQAKLTIAKARKNSVTTDQSVDLALAQAMLQQRRRSSTVSLFQIVNSPLRRRSTASSISSRRSLSINQGDDWKAAKTGLICMSTFLFCWAPFFVIIMILSSADPSLVPAWAGNLCIWMAFFSCTLNPLVYVFRNRQIRKQVASMLYFGKAKLLNEHRINTASPHSYPQLTILGNGNISRTSSVVTFHAVDMKQAPLLQLWLQWTFHVIKIQKAQEFNLLHDQKKQTVRSTRD